MTVAEHAGTPPPVRPFIRPSRRPSFPPTRCDAAPVPVLLAFSLGASLLGACSASGARAQGSGGTGGGAATGAGGSSGTFGFGGTSGAGGSGGCPSCSADLKKVVGCDGEVAEECGPGSACAAGACIDDPCEAARLGQATTGCDYWTVKPDTFPLSSCFAIFVANTWSEGVHLRMERAGMPMDVTPFTRIPKGQGAALTYEPFDPAVGIPPGEVAILFISFGFGALAVPCPAGIPPAITGDPSVLGTGIGQAFHLTTDAPVVAYQIFPYGGGNVAQTSATLLLPATAWGDNHVAVNPGFGSAFNAIDVIAAENDTDVTISPKVAIQPGAGVQGTPAGQPVTYRLARGEYLQINQFEELTGSAMAANKPIGVFGSTNCLNVPTSACCCDSAHQQVPSVKTLGHEYVAVRYRTRQSKASPGEEDTPWRMVGVVDGTALTYEPAPPAGAPTTLNLGDAVDFWTTEPFVVRAQDEQHPFYLAGYMTGCEYIAPMGLEGDAEWVNAVPTAQFRESYVFFSDPTYPETNLVLIRKKGEDGITADVTLDCAGVLGGWTPIGGYEYARFDLVTGGAAGACGNGRHVISSELPFGLTVWGWGNDFVTQAVSYAYPAGQGLKPVNDVYVPPIPR